MKNKLTVVVVLYFVLNILVTYLVTSSIFNPNIVNFDTLVINEIISIIGNVAILLLILVIGLFFIKKERNLSKYILIITFILNFLIFLLGYFTKNFKTMLSFYNLSLFRNPNAGFAYQMVLDGLAEMFSSWQLLCFFPSLVLLIIYIINKKNLSGKRKIALSFKMILLLSSLLSSLLSLSYFRYKVENEWPFRSDIVQYGVQTCGIYNYYFGELVIGIDYNDAYDERIKNSERDLKLYDKNSLENINIIDQNKYNNQNVGILEGMNLFVIQAESLQNFVIRFQYKDELLMPYMNDFIADENVFYFSNVHTVVGLGNTSDAEFAFNTGYYPLGDLTIAWEAYDKVFDIQSLPKMFSDKYISYSYNPTIEGFYAHKYVHENLYAFKQFSGFETFERNYPYINHKDRYLHKKWVSDEAILDFAMLNAKNVLTNAKNFYVFAQTISPHYPFVDLSKAYSKPHDSIDFGDLENKFQNYLNQINYNDKVIYDFLLKAKDELDNTVFIIYGDHGNTLSKKSYEKLFNKKITDIEYRKILLEIPVIIYDPSGKISSYIKVNNLNHEYMFDRTLSQIDLFSTVNSLYNLGSEHKLGVNMFSFEPSFLIEPKGLDIITDGFFYSLKNGTYQLEENEYNQMIDIVKRIKEFKLANDSYLTKKVRS